MRVADPALPARGPFYFAEIFALRLAGAVLDFETARSLGWTIEHSGRRALATSSSLSHNAPGVS